METENRNMDEKKDIIGGQNQVLQKNYESQIDRENNKWHSIQSSA